MAVWSASLSDFTVWEPSEWCRTQLALRWGDHRGWVIIFLTAPQHMTLKELATIRRNSSVDTWVSPFLCPCPLPYQLLPRLQTKAFTSEGHTAPN